MPAGKGQHPQSLPGELLIDLFHFRPLLGGDDAAVHQNVHGALGDHHQTAGQLMDGAHQLPVGVKGDLRQAGPAGAGGLLVKAVVLPQTDQRRLSGVAHLPVFVHRGVAAQQRRPQQRLLDRVVEVRARRVNDLAAGVYLLHRHFVLGQGAGLIRADDGHAAQTLHRLELADDGVFLRHLLGSEGQHDGDNGAERLGNGRHGQGHGEQEGVHDVLLPQKHADAEQHGTDDQDTDGELSAELVQTDLERRFLLLGAFQKRGDFAHLRVHAGGRDQEPGPAIGDEAAGEHHVLPVAQWDLPLDLMDVLLHRQALAGQGALRAF